MRSYAQGRRTAKQHREGWMRQYHELMLQVGKRGINWDSAVFAYNRGLTPEEAADLAVVEEAIAVEHDGWTTKGMLEARARLGRDK